MAFTFRTSMPWVLLTALPHLVACGHPPTTDGPPVPVLGADALNLAPAREELLDTLYRTSGTVRGRSTAVLTSKTTGYVRTIAVTPGARVVAGQLLAVLEANDVAAGVRRTRAGLEQSLEAKTEAENALRAAQVAARIAKTSHDRAAALFAEKAVSRQEFDDTEARWRSAAAQEAMAEARVRSSAARIDQAKAEVGEAQATLDYARITAPFAGRVIERRADPGNLATPGMPILVLEQDGRLRVETYVEESRAASVLLGDAVTVDVGATGAPATGQISEVVPAVDVASRAFLVKVDLPEETQGLRPGMFARVTFRTGQKSRLVVPTAAITSLGALDRVFVAEGDRLRLRMVTRGETQGPWTEILSGLRPG